MPKQITLRGKVYKKVANYSYKWRAKLKAKRYRENGYYATVKPYTSKFFGKQYGVYARKR